MAEINKLSVGKVLDKLRSADAPKAKMMQLDDKMKALEEEIQRMRAVRNRLKKSPASGHD